MATGRNGSFNISTSNQFVSGYVSWNETYDIASNSSVVNAELRLSRTNTGYETYSSGEFYIAINGNEKRNSETFSFTYNSNTLCVSHSVTVPHNADGSKSIEIYAGGELYYISPGLTVSKQSSTVTLTTIPRASSLSAPNGTLGSTIRLTVNRASSAFTHTIIWSAGGQSDSLTGVGAYVDWSVPYVIANGNTSGASIACSFTLITYNSGAEIGRSPAGCTLYIPNDNTTKPTLSVSNITVTNSENISSWSEAIKGISKLKLSISSSSGKYGATISSRKITTSDGQSTTSTSLEVTPNTSGTYKFSATVTDTRGFPSNVVEKTISVYDYAPPVISRASVERCTSGGSSANEGTYVKINASYGYTNINGKNSITSAYASYRVSGSGAEYTSLGNISNGTPVVLGNGQLNIGASYDIRLTVTDTVGESDTYYLTLSTAKANIVAGFNKVGLGKYPEKDGYLEVGYKTKFEDDVEFENPEQVRNAINAEKAFNTLAWNKGGTGRSDWGGLDTPYSVMAKSPNGDWLTAIQTQSGALYANGTDGACRFGVLPISAGGTEATTKAGARKNLGIDFSNIDSLWINSSPVNGWLLQFQAPNSVDNHTYRIGFDKWGGVYGIDDTAGTSIWNIRPYGFKKASVTFSNSIGTMSASGVTTSSAIMAIRGDSNVTGSYYSIGAADCNSAGTIKLAQANGSSTNATWTVSAWWSK